MLRIPNLPNRLFAFLVVLLISGPAFTQILNIDRITQQRDQFKEDKNAYVSITSNYLLLSQESDLSVFTFNTEFTYLFENNALSFISNFNLTKSDEEDLVNKGHAQLVYLFNYNAKFTPEFISQYQWDGPLGMDDRYLMGFNARFNVVNDSIRLLTLAAGLMYERETWLEPDTEEFVYNKGVKINTYFNYMHRFSESFDLGIRTYIQAKVNKDIIYPRISPSFQLNFKVSDSLSYVANASFIYDPKPVIDIRKYHFQITNGFRFSM